VKLGAFEVMMPSSQNRMSPSSHGLYFISCYPTFVMSPPHQVSNIVTITMMVICVKLWTV